MRKPRTCSVTIATAVQLYSVLQKEYMFVESTIAKDN